MLHVNIPTDVRTFECIDNIHETTNTLCLLDCFELTELHIQKGSTQQVPKQQPPSKYGDRGCYSQEPCIKISKEKQSNESNMECTRKQDTLLCVKSKKARTTSPGR